MLFTTAASCSLFVASTLALAGPQPYLLRRNPAPDFSINHGLGLMARQANGYAPTYGPECTNGGDTCETACGPTYLQCPSNSGIHCFDTAKQQSCCSDGNGYACDAGYYCTNTPSLETWCCPNGVNLVDCAAAYSLTEVLRSITTEAVGATASASAPPSTSAATTSSYSVPASPTVVGTGAYTPTPTGAAQFTGAAAPKAGVGGAVGGLVLAAGALLL